MSRLVIMEGWINQKTKNREICEVYVVLTKSHLKIYKSQINYKQRPDDTLRVLDLSESYNILPMSFDNEFTFSVFKKGEKAIDRLYLHASSKSDYDFWLSQIEGVLSPKMKESDTNTANGDNSNSREKRISTENLEKSPKPTYYIRNNSVTSKDEMDCKASLDKCSKLERELENCRKTIESTKKENEEMKKEIQIFTSDLTKMQDNYTKSTKEIENLQKDNIQIQSKLKTANDENRRIQSEKQQIIDKKTKLEREIETMMKKSDNIEKEDKRMNQILTDLSARINSTNIDLSSYMFCIDNLIDKYRSTTILDSLFKQQLVNMIHKCPIDLNTNKTLIDYLTVQIDLSQDSVIQFISKLLTTLANQMSKTQNIGSTPDANIISIIRNVVTMTKPSQKSESHLSFHQTSLEIAYLLTKRANSKFQFTNAISDDVMKAIDNKFEAFLKTYKFDSTKKVILLELGEHVKEKIQLQLEKENVKKPEITEKSNSVLRNCIDRKWNEMLRKLDEKNQEISDLNIVVRELSGKINTLEAECGNSNSYFASDEFFNTFFMNADILCSTCQTKAVNLLEMPVHEKMNNIISDLKSYWRSITNIQFSLNLKQTNSNASLREINEKIIQSNAEFESLVKKFSEITHRTIEKPSSQKPSPISNDQ